MEVKAWVRRREDVIRRKDEGARAAKSRRGVEDVRVKVNDRWEERGGRKL